MDNKAWLIKYQQLKQEVNCCNCKFFDGCCCMYECACRAILHEDRTAKNCTHFELGEYNQDLLEQTDYR